MRICQSMLSPYMLKSSKRGRQLLLDLLNLKCISHCNAGHNKGYICIFSLIQELEVLHAQHSTMCIALQDLIVSFLCKCMGEKVNKKQSVLDYENVHSMFHKQSIIYQEAKHPFILQIQKHQDVVKLMNIYVYNILRLGFSK